MKIKILRPVFINGEACVPGSEMNIDQKDAVDLIRMKKAKPLEEMLEPQAMGDSKKKK